MLDFEKAAIGGVLCFTLAGGFFIGKAARDDRFQRAEEALAQAGLDNVQLQTRNLSDLFEEGRRCQDTGEIERLSFKFSATNKEGQEVTGVVCRKYFFSADRNFSVKFNLGKGL